MRVLRLLRSDFMHEMLLRSDLAIVWSWLGLVDGRRRVSGIGKRSNGLIDRRQSYK